MAPLGLALVAGLLALAIFAYVVRARRDLEAARADTDALAEALEREMRRSRHLAREVELLSAIREVSLIANDDVSFTRILADVLKVIEEVCETRSLAIYLRDEGAAAAGPEWPRPRARREDGVARFDAEAAPRDESEAALVAEAWRLRRSRQRVEPDRVSIATLLSADAEVFGVIVATAAAPSPDGEDGEDGGIAALEAALEALTKHVALAVRKPTLYDRAVIDSLTRLYTKRHFTSQLARYLAESRRTRAPLALALFDIDHFKKVNDGHGHLTGDLVLAEVAATVRATIREYDSAYRYGGEEMAVIAPDATVEGARGLAERVRRAVEGKTFRTDRGEPLRVTISAGVAAFGPETAEPPALVGAADRALYEAKHGGRNRVRAAGDPPLPEPTAQAPPEGPTFPPPSVTAVDARESARAGKKRPPETSSPRPKRMRSARVE